MDSNNKLLQIIINWNRWTIGVVWEFYKNEKNWQLEISLQIPVIALSILLKNK